MKKYCFRVSLMLLLTIPSFFSLGQNTDSLKLMLSRDENDSLYYHAADNLAWEYMYHNTDTAVYYENLALERALLVNDKLGIVNAYNTLGVCYIVFGDYFEAVKYLDMAMDGGVELLKSDTSNTLYKRRLLAVYANKGNVYFFQALYDKAIDNYIKSLKLSMELNYQPGISTCISNIGASYLDLSNYSKALEYQYKALENAYLVGEKSTIAQCMANIGAVYFEIPDYDSAYYYFSRGLKLADSGSNESNYTTICINMGDVFREMKQYDSAYFYYDKALKLSEKLSFSQGLINCNYMIGQYFKQLKQYDKAEKYFKDCLEQATENGTQKFIMLANERLSELYKIRGDYRLAYKSYYDGTKVRESIFNKDREKSIADMETKYRTEEKEKEIVFLNEKNKLLDENVRITHLIIAFLTLIFVLVLVLIIISYRSYKNRQLAIKRKVESESERKLLDTIINTEYKERRRFAEDLHDGLGVLLSTLRLYLNEINNAPSPQKREDIIKRSNIMLDEAIANTRNISNNIMPAALKNDGLLLTLRSFCDKINASGKIKIKISSINFDKRLKSANEISLYRVLTEMINNTLKHAAANEINIDFTIKENKLFVTYRDNGKGFDYEGVMNTGSKGQGLHNTLSRINSIGGKFTIKSKEGKGFFAGIEISCS
jgi:signal transduction histidine kinase